MSLVIGAALLSGLAFWSLHRPLAAQPLDAVPQVATEVTPVETSASQQAEQSGNPTSDVPDKKEHRSASSPRCRWHPAARFLAACRQATDTGPARQSVPPPATAAVAMPDDDVTKVGILTNANFRGDKASILGLRLGQTWDEARKAVQANPELMIREDRMSRFYVYDRRGSEAGGRSSIANGPMALQEWAAW